LAAKIVEVTNPDVLDINFGCPVKKVAMRGAGAGVLKDIDLMVRLTEAVVKSTSLPVTVKTRLGWDENTKNIEEVAERLQDVGIQALAIHGRTRTQMYKGEADWTLIGKVKNNPRIQIPIIGNGDIESPEKALAYKNRYGVDGVMIGRAAIGYPWIFDEIKHFVKTGEHLPSPSITDRIAVCRKHLKLSVEWKGPIVGINEMRRHYTNYLKGLPNIKAFRQRLVTLPTEADINEVLDEIAATYQGYEFEKTAIELINYHEKCAV
ncbi:MAG TPA: tRNA-dihydrouridine synthase, partial [Chitinophagaceae bacterium]|nr:tRNA-dihydrouridine synthase [Chitinophagaceae bacterium]